MAAKPKRISQQELVEKIRDIEISDEEIASYFILDDSVSEAFSPRVIPNPDLIEGQWPGRRFCYQFI